MICYSCLVHWLNAAKLVWFPIDSLASILQKYSTLASNPKMYISAFCQEFIVLTGQYHAFIRLLQSNICFAIYSRHGCSLCCISKAHEHQPEADSEDNFCVAISHWICLKSNARHTFSILLAASDILCGNWCTFFCAPIVFFLFIVGNVPSITRLTFIVHHQSPLRRCLWFAFFNCWSPFRDRVPWFRPNGDEGPEIDFQVKIICELEGI